MWNRSDELRFIKLSEELAVLEENRHNCLRRLRAVLERIESTSGRTIEGAITAMIANAEELRDALQPFDSGIRAAPPPAPEAPQMQPAPVPAPRGYERHSGGKSAPVSVLFEPGDMVELIDANGVRVVYSALNAPWETVVFWKLADGNK